MRIAKIKHRLTLSRGPLQVINLDAPLLQMGLFIPAHTQVKKKIAFLNPKRCGLFSELRMRGWSKRAQ